MNIIVCVKQIVDPEMPPVKFKVDEVNLRVVPPEGIPPVTSPFDEQAAEAALRIKDKEDTKITVISLGSGSAIDVVRHVLAMGADEGIVLNDAIFEGSDSLSTAYILTKAIEKVGETAPYDLILCGRQAADWDSGQVGSIIAENLGIPVVTLARNIEVVDGRLRVERVILDGYETFEMPLPSLITISNELGQPRLPAGMGIIKAARKSIPTWTAQDIGVDASQVGIQAARSKLRKLFIPVRERKCEIIKGGNEAEAAISLALRLRESRII